MHKKPFSFIDTVFSLTVYMTLHLLAYKLHFCLQKDGQAGKVANIAAERLATLTSENMAQNPT